MKRMLKSTLAICLVLMMVLSTIAVSATTNETEAAELTTVYTKDFTKDTDLTGWTNQSATVDSNGMHLKGGAVNFYQEDLGDVFSVSTTVNHSYSSYTFMINSDGTASKGVQVIYSKHGELMLEDDTKYDAYYVRVIVDGKKPAGWKDKVIIPDLSYRDKDGIFTDDNSDFILYEDANYLLYKTYVAKIDYNDGIVSGSIGPVDFTYDLTQGGTIVPATNNGYFGIVGSANSGGHGYVKNVEIKKEISKYITVYEQDFTKAGATTEGLDVVGATVDATDGLKLANGDAFIYDKTLGNKYRISGKIDIKSDATWANFDYKIFLNSDANVADGVFSAQNGYIFHAWKYSYRIDLLLNGKHGSDMGHYALASFSGGKDLSNVGELNFELEVDGTYLTYTITSPDGATVYATKTTYNLSNANTNWTDGIFGISNPTANTEIRIKNLKIEKAMSNYITLFDRDFTETGATTEGLDVVGTTVNTTDGLKICSQEGFVFDKNLGNKWCISGKLMVDDGSDYQYNVNLYYNSDAEISNGVLNVQNGYLNKIGKQSTWFQLLTDGVPGGGDGRTTFENLTTHTNVNGADINFKYERDEDIFRYTLTSLDGATVYAEREYDLTKNFNGGTIDVFEDGKFALLNTHPTDAVCRIKSLKIGVISDYAVADAEAIAKSNGNVKYSAIVHNNSGNPVTGAVLVAAAYDADKNLIGATVIDDYTGAVGKQLVDGEIEIENGKKAEEVVIYFWDNFDSAYPLYEQTTIEL